MAAVQEKKRTTIHRNFIKWTAIQSIYMPESVQARLVKAAAPTLAPDGGASGVEEDEDGLLALDPVDSDDDWGDVEEDGLDSSRRRVTKPFPSMTSGTETFELYLPSGLNDSDRLVCDKNIVKLEIQIRLALLESTLNKLRRLLRVKARVLKQKKRHIIGQKSSTRAYKTVAQYTSKINAVAERYRSVRSNLTRLDMGDWSALFQELKQERWHERYRVLKEEDVRPPHWDPESDIDDDDEKKKKKKKGSAKTQMHKRALGEGKKESSWIWRVASDEVLEDESGLDMTSFTVWAKAQARLYRWQEERELSIEEMRRIPWDLEYQASLWEQRAAASLHDHIQDPSVIVGAKAYAMKCAYMWRRLSIHFTDMWKPELVKLGVELPKWPVQSVQGSKGKGRE